MSRDIRGMLCVLALACAITGFGAQAQTFPTLVDFTGANGSQPRYESLVEGVDGALYGTTLTGGADNAGTIFRITFQGHLTNLHSFDGSDGSDPDAGLTVAPDGVLYGTAAYLGASNAGTVFKIEMLTTLDTFNGSDGASRFGALAAAFNGMLYGRLPARNRSKIRGDRASVVNSVRGGTPRGMIWSKTACNSVG